MIILRQKEFNENVAKPSLRKQLNKMGEEIINSVNSDIDRGVNESQRKLDEWGNEMRDKFKNVGKERRPNMFIKKAWNGEIGMGKTGNRALMIGAPIAIAGGTALALRKKNKKEE